MAQAEYITSAIRAPITGASPKASTNPIQEAHAELIAVAGDLPRPIPVDTHAIDLDGLAGRLA